MMDFVSSLITRSFTEQPVLRPRLASLFEPAANADFAPAEAARSEDTRLVHEVEVDREATPNAERVARAVRHERPPAQNQSPVVAPMLSPGAMSLRFVPAMVEEHLQERNAVSRARKAPSAVREEPEIGAAIEPRTKATDAASRPFSASLPSAANAPERTAQRDPREQLVIAPKAIPEIAVPHRRAESSREVQLPQGAQHRAATALRSLSTSSETTVNVSIGRIEVRAVSENKPAQRSRPASPVMSLEDYLQRRGGSR